MPAAPKKLGLKAAAQKSSRRFLSSLKKVVLSVFSKGSDDKKNAKDQPEYRLLQTPDIMITNEEGEEEDWDVVYHDELANNSAHGNERTTMEELEFVAREDQDLLGSRRFMY